MSGKSKKPRSRKPRTQSAKAGLSFPVARIARKLRRHCGTKRVGATAPVFMAGVLEYMTAEILELAGNSARDHKKKRITPRNIKLAIADDAEISQLLSNADVGGGGVFPFIHKALLPKKSKAKSAASSSPVY